MTIAQEKAIERIRGLVDKECGKRYEVKEFRIKENEYFVSVYVVYGLPDDEGTMAETFARDHAHLFVGKKGGVTFPVHKTGKQIVRRFHWYSILEAVVAQFD